jgi:hypothetical protein
MGNQGGTGGFTYFTESVWGFPWTTGTVTAMAPANPFCGIGAKSVNLTAKGSDERTPQGQGKLQLVTPLVVRKREKGTGALLEATAGISIVSLRFAPEPSAMLQLAAGLGGLGILYRCQRRRK